MILRTIINIVMWTWGLGPIVVNEINETVALIMMFGAFVDLLTLSVIIALIISSITSHNRVAKKCIEVK